MPRVKKKVGWIALAGPAAFVTGLLIAIAATAVPPSGWLYFALGVIGVIAGIIITARETGPFLLASIAIIVAALSMQVLMTAGLALVEKVVPGELTRLAANVVTILGAAVTVVALRAIYDILKGG